MKTSEKIYYARERWHTSFTELAFHYNLTEATVKRLYHQEQIKRLPTIKSPSEPIECLNLSARAWHCLKRRGIDTIGQLFALDKNYLEQIPACGSQTVAEIIDAIASARAVLERKNPR